MVARSLLGTFALYSVVAATNYCGTSTVYTTITVPYPKEAGPTSIVSTRPTPTQFQPGGPAGGQYHGPAWLPSGSNLKPSLIPQQQNGDCLLGLPDAPQYGGPIPGDIPGSPWGTNPPWQGNPGHGGNSSGPTDNCVLINPDKIPETGKTRKYTFDIGYRNIAPDGVKKQGLVINGGFPGPTIEANWGDWIEVTVNNNLAGKLGNAEGTTVHWHGLLQKETPFMDGIPGVSQCPIVPGDSFTYRFRADQYGTTWYHSHYSAQYSGGVYGAIIIHGPNDAPECAGYDTDLGPVLVGDWYHKKYFDLVAETMNSTTGLPPASNSNLINGRANYPCQNTTLECTPNAGLSKFKFTSGKKHRMRLINPSSDAVQKISIDGHKFTVIAQDFVPIVSYQTDLITLAIGQRADVIVEAVGKPTDSFWLRSTLGVGPTGCSLPDGIAPDAMAVVYYEKADPDAVPTTTSDFDQSKVFVCANDPLSATVPLFPISADPVGELYTQVFNIDFINNGTNFLWTVNNISARVDYGISQLNEAVKGDLNPKKEWNIYTLPNSGTARFVMYNSFPFSGHPMHLHGHNFQVLAEGFGQWDGSITNPSNPVRRDVQFLQKAQQNADGSVTRSYSVIQIELDNPTINALHCHLAWHVSGGLYVALVERPNDIKKHKVPDSVPESCSKWANFIKTTVPDQIDSGI